MQTLPEVVLIESSIQDEILCLQGIRSAGVPCDVTVEREASEVLKNLLHSHRTPSLLVYDCAHPDSNALEIVSRIRRNDNTRSLPIVILTRTDGNHGMAECLRIGANSCVAKPDDPSEIAGLMCQIVLYWLTINKEPNHPEFLNVGARRAELAFASV